MQDCTEIHIRETLSHYAKPRASSAAASEIVALSIRCAATRRGRHLWVRRALLSCYWLAALIGTLAIVSSVPLPEWIPAPLTTSVALAIPVLGVLLLCGEPIINLLRGWSARYLSTRSN
jgi:hypothetical protein